MSMRRVKVFDVDTSDPVEEQINDWLDSNKGVVIESITQSESAATDEWTDFWHLTIIIWYRF